MPALFRLSVAIVVVIVFFEHGGDAYVRQKRETRKTSLHELLKRKINPGDAALPEVSQDTELGEEVSQYARSSPIANVPSYADPNLLSAVMSQAESANFRYRLQMTEPPVKQVQQTRVASKQELSAKETNEIDPYQLFPPEFHELLDIPMHINNNGSSNTRQKANKPVAPLISSGYANTEINGRPSQSYGAHDKRIPQRPKVTYQSPPPRGKSPKPTQVYRPTITTTQPTSTTTTYNIPNRPRIPFTYPTRPSYPQPTIINRVTSQATGRLPPPGLFRKKNTMIKIPTRPPLRMRNKHVSTTVTYTTTQTTVPTESYTTANIPLQYDSRRTPPTPTSLKPFAKIVGSKVAKVSIKNFPKLFATTLKPKTELNKSRFQPSKIDPYIKNQNKYKYPSLIPSLESRQPIIPHKQDSVNTPEVLPPVVNTFKRNQQISPPVIEPFKASDRIRDYSNQDSFEFKPPIASNPSAFFSNFKNPLPFGSLSPSFDQKPTPRPINNLSSVLPKQRPSSPQLRRNRPFHPRPFDKRPSNPFMRPPPPPPTSNRRKIQASLPPTLLSPPEKFKFEKLPINLPSRRRRPPLRSTGRPIIRKRPSFLEKLGFFKKSSSSINRRYGESSPSVNKIKSKKNTVHKEAKSKDQRIQEGKYKLVRGPLPPNAQKVRVVGPFKKPPIGAPKVLPYKRLPHQLHRNRPGIHPPMQLTPPSSQINGFTKKLVHKPNQTSHALMNRPPSFQVFHVKDVKNKSEQRNKAKPKTDKFLRNAPPKKMLPPPQKTKNHKFATIVEPIIYGKQNPAHRKFIKGDSAIAQVQAGYNMAVSPKLKERSSAPVYNGEVSEAQKESLIAAKFTFPRLSGVQRSGMQRDIIPIPVPILSPSGKQVSSFHKIILPKFPNLPSPQSRKIEVAAPSFLNNPYRVPVHYDLRPTLPAMAPTPAPGIMKVTEFTPTKELTKASTVYPVSYQEPNAPQFQYDGWKTYNSDSAQGNVKAVTSYVKENTPEIILKTPKPEANINQSTVKEPIVDTEIDKHVVVGTKVEDKPENLVKFSSNVKIDAPEVIKSYLISPPISLH